MLAVYELILTEMAKGIWGGWGWNGSEKSIFDYTDRNKALIETRGSTYLRNSND